MSTKTNFRFNDGMRCLVWLQEVYPDIFKEFIAVYDVYEKANESRQDENPFGSAPMKGEGMKVGYDLRGKKVKL